MGARPNPSGLPTGPIFTGPRDFSSLPVVAIDPPRDRGPRGSRTRGPRGFRGPIATGPRTRVPGSFRDPSRVPGGFRDPIRTGDKPSRPSVISGVREIEFQLPSPEDLFGGAPPRVYPQPFPPAPVPPRPNKPTFNRIPGYPYEAIEQFNRMY